MTPDLDLQNKALQAMHEGGLSTRQIESVISNLDHASIARRLRKLTPRRTTQIYREVRADVLAERQRQILMLSATPGARNGRDQRDYATAYGVYYDKERLERGQATENIGYLDYNRAFEQINTERRRLAQELGIDPDGAGDSQNLPVNEGL